MNFLGIIPARFASTRFPGKPLAMIKGKTMLSRVYEQACKASSLSKVIIATDDERIRKHAEDIGAIAVMTSIEHKSGTDRCYEAVKIFIQTSDFINHKSQIINHKSDDVIVNIQGDEPFINPAQIDTLCDCFKSPDTKIATLIKKISDYKELFNPNIVKVVTDKNMRAVYFSRSPIPFMRGKENKDWLSFHTYFKHIGIYAYTLNTLKNITALEMSDLEKCESLEQLRWLENGLSIQTQVTDFESIAIDTPDDLLTINQQ